MGLFGRKESNVTVSTVDLEAERQKKAEQAMRDELQKRYEAVSQIKGSRGRGEGSFEEGVDYIFHITEDKYVFEPVFSVSPYTKAETLEKAMNYSPIEFMKSQTETVLEETALVEKTVHEAVGETMVTVAPIRVAFIDKTNNSHSVFMFTNKPQNISPYADFFKEVGVRNFFNITNIPEDILQIKVLHGNGFISSNTTYAIFRNEGKLTMLRPPAMGGTSCYICEIGIDEILYYRQEGALRYEQQITGSGGGSTSYTGAIVGGLLFGVTGALIGSRANEKETNISTEIIEKDTRILYLVVKRQGLVYQISFSLDAEMVFNWILPDKQYDYVIQKRREVYEKQTSEYEH